MPDSQQTTHQQMLDVGGHIDMNSFAISSVEQDVKKMNREDLEDFAIGAFMAWFRRVASEASPLK